LKFRMSSRRWKAGEDRTPMLSVVNDETVRADGRSVLDEICREGARTMLAAALETEVDAYLAELAGERDENGHARALRVQTVAGAVEIRAQRVNDRRVDEETGKKARFKSLIVPPWCRRSPKVTEVLPLAYLRGLSSGGLAPELEGLVSSAAGRSASTVTRLTSTWQAEQRAFMGRNLSDRDYLYVWVDGVAFNVRLDQERLCCLVVVGVRLDGRNQLVAIADGYRGSPDSGAALLRDLRRRGMRAPVVAVRDGALGFWAALREVFPEVQVSGRGESHPPATHLILDTHLPNRPTDRPASDLRQRSVGGTSWRSEGGRQRETVHRHVIAGELEGNYIISIL